MIFRPGVTGQRNTKHFRVIESDLMISEAPPLPRITIFYL